MCYWVPSARWSERLWAKEVQMVEPLRWGVIGSGAIEILSRVVDEIFGAASLPGISC